MWTQRSRLRPFSTTMPNVLRGSEICQRQVICSPGFAIRQLRQPDHLLVEPLLQ